MLVLGLSVNEIYHPEGFLSEIWSSKDGYNLQRCRYLNWQRILILPHFFHHNTQAGINRLLIWGGNLQTKESRRGGRPVQPAV